MLAETPRRKHTDIISHSANGFPAATGEEALAFFRSVGDGSIGTYLGSHPAALAFIQMPKPTPSSFGKERYFAVNAFKFVAADGKETFFRYRFVPVAGEEYLDDEMLKTKTPNFLFDNVGELLAAGPIEFKLVAQIAEPGDVTDDCTVQWPEERKLVELGTVSLTALAEEDAEKQRTVIFDPIPRVDGIVESADPILQVRAGVYIISGKERRAATPA